MKNNPNKSKSKISISSSSKENPKKTKILAVGDLHGDERLVRRLAEKAEKENVDLVILTGDLTFAETSTKNIVGPFVRAKKQVLLIPGNHEGVATIAETLKICEFIIQGSKPLGTHEWPTIADYYSSYRSTT